MKSLMLSVKTARCLSHSVFQLLGVMVVLPITAERITMLAMELISLKLPSALRAKVAAEARRRNVSQSMIIRESLERSLASTATRDEVSCTDLAGNLSGSFRSGRRDLSTNKQVLTDAVTRNAHRGRKRRR
jgi:hypothetical protein